MKKKLRLFPIPKMVLAEKGDQCSLYGCAGAFQIELIR
jgi:hypothetical protein